MEIKHTILMFNFKITLNSHEEWYVLYIIRLISSKSLIYKEYTYVV